FVVGRDRCRHGCLPAGHLQRPEVAEIHSDEQGVRASGHQKKPSPLMSLGLMVAIRRPASRRLAQSLPRRCLAAALCSFSYATSSAPTVPRTWWLRFLPKEPTREVSTGSGRRHPMPVQPSVAVTPWSPSFPPLVA